MEGTNGSNPRSEAVASAADWRAQLLPADRQRMIDKILDTLRRHLQKPVPEDIAKLRKIAARFEEKMYDEATSQGDYLKKISLKMLSMESKSRQAPAEMEGTNGSTPQSEAVAAAAADWRAQLLPAARQRIINKILATLLRHLPGIAELHKIAAHKIAAQFEEKVYDGATSQDDYLKKISLKMLSMEAKSRRAPADLISKL